MKQLHIFIFSLFLASCTNSNLHKQLAKDPIISKHYSKNEIRTLEDIITYVDEIVVSETQITNIDEAYHHYIDSILLRSFDPNYNIAFDEKNKYTFIFSLDTNVYNSIWKTNSFHSKIKTKDTILTNINGIVCIDINIWGRYMNILKELGDSNLFYKTAHEACGSTGGLSPPLRIGFMQRNRTFNFNNINDRLWVAIFLLSNEETIEQKVRRHLAK